jgi:hypothetical protein
MKKRTSPAQNEERGAILILMALALVPLILLLALAVDTTRLSTSHSQLREVAGFSALAAMKAYGDADSSLTYGEKIEAAFVAAEETMQRESNRLIGRQFEGASPAAKFRDPVGVSSEDRSYPNDENVNGTLRAGNWWFTEPVDPNTGMQDCQGWLNDQNNAPNTGPMDSKCPCPTVSGTAVWKGACFERNDDTATTAGAFEIELFTRENSPIKTIFAAIGGADSFDLAAAAWATKVPRRGVFIIDLSKSMTFDTHLDEGPNSTDYAFALRNRNCIGPNNYTNFCINSECSAANCPGTEDYRTNQCGMDEINQDYRFRRGSFDPGSQELEPTRPTSPLEPAWRHFKDDYQCVDVETTPGTTESYLIDTDGMLPVALPNRPHLVSGSTEYQGAEPLTAVLGGVNRALEVILERALAGDEIGVIFVDEEILDARKHPETGLTSPQETVFEKLLRITDVNIADDSPSKSKSGHPLQGTNYSDNLAERLKAVVFPRMINGRTANTDLPRALVESVNMLNSQARVGSQADNYVAIFTDGISNCSHRAPGSGGGRNFQPDPFLPHDRFIRNNPDANGNWLMRASTCPNVIRPNDGANSTENLAAKRVRQLNNYLVSLQEAATVVAGKVNEADSPDYDLPNGFRSYVERGYEVHVFLTGAKVQPNNLIRPAKRDSSGNPNGCMSQEEAINSNYPYAYGGVPLPDTNPAISTYDDPGSQGDNYVQNTTDDPNAFQHYPNQALYNTLVAPTGGIWAPVRPPCNPADAPGAGGALTQTQCENGELVERLDQHCDNAVTAHGDPMTPNPDISVVDVPGMIENGALICDPYCRSTAKSVGDNVEKIYENNPFILVESAFKRSDVD